LLEGINRLQNKIKTKHGNGILGDEHAGAKKSGKPSLSTYSK
jgi:hypothetical protein